MKISRVKKNKRFTPFNNLSIIENKDCPIHTLVELLYIQKKCQFFQLKLKKSSNTIESAIKLLALQTVV